MIERIDTICLKVSNVEAASAWYQEILGFKEAFRADHYCILSIGDSRVPLTIEQGNGGANKDGTYPIFFSKDPEKTFSKLKEMGVEVEEIQRDGANTFFDFYDLDHNKLQICYWE